MKKIYKYIILLILLIFISVYFNTKPKDFNHSYENAQIYKNGVKEKNVDIKISGKILKDKFLFKKLKFNDVLKGHIIIDGLIYYIFPTDSYIFPNEDGIYTDNNTYSGLLSSTKNELKEVYYFYLSKNNDMLYIYSIEYNENGTTDTEEILYPVRTNDDYIKIKNKLHK